LKTLLSRKKRFGWNNFLINILMQKKVYINSSVSRLVVASFQIISKLEEMIYANESVVSNLF
jgi:hypothetical protein